MARIDHPNVVGVLDAGEEHGAPYLVMELLRGESVGARLRRGPMTVDEVLDAIVPACRGVAAAHAEGIVHRDLKPDNLFLCAGKDGTKRAPKVLDFGVSKLFEEDVERITKTGISMGTPGYMCPEQLGAPRAVDPRFDVYSMGVVLYEALTGRRPYEADGLYELCRRIARGQPPPIRALAPHVPPALEAIVMRAMHVRADQRFQSMLELASSLEHVRAGMPSTDAAPRRLWPLALVVSVLGALGIGAAIAVALVVTMAREDDAPPPPVAQARPAPPPSPQPPVAPPPPIAVDAGPPPVRSELTITGCDAVFQPVARSLVRAAYLHIGTDLGPTPDLGSDHYLSIQTADAVLPDEVELPQRTSGYVVLVKLALRDAEWLNVPQSRERGRISIRRPAHNRAEIAFENVHLTGPLPRSGHILGGRRGAQTCVLNGRVFL
jgi:hypothetical protein